jgi:hypothetical protein
MGRTIPSFRLASVEEQKEWKRFRQVLDKSDRKTFDDMFSIAHLYNSACSFTIKPIRIHPIFMSIIFHHYKQLMKIKEELEKKKDKIPNQICDSLSIYVCIIRMLLYFC